MVKILFICHGNICRSPMAEFFMRDYVKKKNRAAAYEIASAATSSEEIGNLVHYGTRKELEKLGISTAGKRARKLAEADGKYYDFLIAMDRFNVRDTEQITRTRSFACSISQRKNATSPTRGIRAISTPRSKTW